MGVRAGTAVTWPEVQDQEQDRSRRGGEAAAGQARPCRLAGSARRAGAGGRGEEGRREEGKLYKGGRPGGGEQVPCPAQPCPCPQECAGKNTMEQTMLDVKKDMQTRGIPMKYFMFDSWCEHGARAVARQATRWEGAPAGASVGASVRDYRCC